MKMCEYQKLQERYIRGWHTWHNESVLSQVWMPDGLCISLQMKDHQYNKVLKYALIGEKGEDQARVFPCAHAYDNSYSSLSFEWLNNEVEVVSALDGQDLCILVTPVKVPPLPSSLIAAGLSLWNRGGVIEKADDHLLLKKGETLIPVYGTEEENGELFCEATGPYLSLSLDKRVGICTGKKRSLAEIEKVIEQGRAKWQQNKAAYGDMQEIYNAMQTCLAWDTVFDPQENTPITTVSRIWNRGWGGYVLFCWDTYFAALMESLDHKELAYLNLIRITNTLTENGFVPNFACQDDFKSRDRSQPPVGSMVAKMIFDRYGEEWVLREVYEKLVRWNQWFYDARRNEQGLMAWGSNAYPIKKGHPFETAEVHDRQGAAYESGLDNSPMYDDIPFDEERGLLTLSDVGLTGLYIGDCYALAYIAGVLQDTAMRERLLCRAHDMEESMETLWDEETGLYLNRRTDTGMFEHRLSPFHFHALFSKKVGQKRARRMMDEHFFNENEFFGAYILPSIARCDPAYPDQVYWRGRIWAPMNFLCYLAVREYDLQDARAALSEKSEKLILQEWL